MKTPNLSPMLSAMALALGLAVPLAAQLPSPDAAERLERATYLQYTAKDLTAAAAAYTELLNLRPPEEIAVRARLHLAAIHVERGDREAAEAAMSELLGRLQVEPQAAEGDGEAWQALLAEIEKGALQGLDRKQLMAAALQGIAQSLGPHAEYWEADALRGMPGGPELSGVGLMLKMTDEGPVVQDLVRGSPAEDAGVQRNWRVVGINGQSWPIGQGKLADAVKEIRGQSGSLVAVDFRISDGSVKRMNLVRRKLDMGEAEWVQSHRSEPDGTPVWQTDDGILTVVIPSFYRTESRRVSTDLRNILQSQQAKAIVLDLRSNGGGHLDEAVAVADLFLREGVIVRLRHKDRTEDKTASAGDELPAVPMVVLVNEATGSAAEILASALQDQGRAILVGRRTYGRGTVRKVIQAPTGGSVLIPIAEFLRSNGAGIERAPGARHDDTWGVTPDVIVPPASADEPVEIPLPFRGAPAPALSPASTKGMMTRAPMADYAARWHRARPDERDAVLKEDPQFQAALTHLRERLAPR